MKAILFICIFISITYLYPVMVQNSPISIVQPDKARLSCFVSGDEFYRRIHDENDFTIMKNEADKYVYAMQSGNRLVQTRFVPGGDVPAVKDYEKLDKPL